MPGRRGRRLIVVMLLLLVLVAIGLWLTPRWIQDRMNPVMPGEIMVGDTARQLHQRLLIADAHADTLLWNRDLQSHNDYGHVDLPRLRAGNVGLQGFTIVTKVPQGQNYQSNAADSDRIRLATIVQGWPPRTWDDLTERALYQAEKLKALAATASEELALIRTRDDLASWRAAREAGSHRVAGFLGIEGGHALSARPANLQRLFDAGIRMLGLVHFHDNALGGSAHGVSQSGLTDFGRQVVVRSEQLGILIDLAHASPALIDDVLALATRPVVVSHTGVAATCPGPRNLTDRQLKAIAANGGLVAIGFWPDAVCGQDVAAIVRAIAHVVALVGIDHVALGSDFDGTVAVPFDAAGMAALTQGLLDAGFTEQQIAAIMGENLYRLLATTLPPEDAG